MPTTLTNAPTLEGPLVTLDEEALEAVKYLVTDNDDPVDNLFSERQQHLLVDALENSWNPTGPAGRRQFVACSDVGIFVHSKQPPLVPDVLVSLDTELATGAANKAYFLWEHKAPELVVEVVSNNEGNELGTKLDKYASWRIRYYVVYDPEHCLEDVDLHVFRLQRGRYVRMRERFLPEVGLGVMLWHGTYYGREDTYLRWSDENGAMLGTGPENTAAQKERADQAEGRADWAEGRADRAEIQVEAQKARAELERVRAELEKARAEKESARAEQESARAEQERARTAEALRRMEEMAAKLRDLGIDPESR